VVTILGVSAMLGQTSEVSSPHQKKFISVCVRGKRGTVQPHLDLSPLDFDVWGNIKPCIQLRWKWTDTSPAHFECLWNHSQSSWDI